MKKILLFSILVFSCLFLAGCTKEKGTLTCSALMEIGGYQMTSVKVTEFDNNKITMFREVLETVATNTESKDNFQDYVSSMVELYPNLSDKKGITFTLSSDVATYTHIFEVMLKYNELDLEELTEFTDIEKEYIELYDKEIDIEQTRKDYETTGYSCTLK